MAAYDYQIADTRPYRAADFTTIIGAELHTGFNELGHIWHILAVGLPLDFDGYPDGETGPQVTQRALDAGAYVAVAHPYWSMLTEADIHSLGDDVHAIEVYNASCASDHDTADSFYHLDLMLARGKRYQLCATDDSHLWENGWDFARGWVMVKAEERSPEALLKALKYGHYYSSTGPRIFDVQIVEKEKIVVTSTSIARAVVIGGVNEHPWAGSPYYQSVAGSQLLETTFDISDWNTPYIRLLLVDHNGERAWTNPFWLE